ncbi:hypothetical protein LCGC14_0636450 [marine sediment metagenome]|uniref:IraD/Gp25-like domain-containing protein n=1 Tax=marine sediment metagenome TaxID=412755 RepID=A0A0F9R0C8_9ZZZZ
MSFDFALVGNDLSILPNGKIRTITDTPKLRQDIIKIVLTPLGSNRFHMWYGCTVGEDTIGKNLPDNMMLLDIRTSIIQSLEKLKELQMRQAIYQKVTLSELMNLIGSVNAFRTKEDMRQIKIEITVYSRNLTKVEEELTLIT